MRVGNVWICGLNATMLLPLSAYIATAATVAVR